MKFTVAATTAFALAAATAILAETVLEPKYCNYRDTSCCPEGTKCLIVSDTGVPLNSAPNNTSVDLPKSSAITAADSNVVPSGIKVCHGREAEKCCPSPPQLCAILAADDVTIEAVGIVWSKSVQGATVAEAAPKTESNTPSSNVIFKRGFCLGGCPIWCYYSPRCYSYMRGSKGGPPIWDKRARAAFDTTRANSADPIAARNNGVPPKCTWMCDNSGTSCFCPSYCVGRCDAFHEKGISVSSLNDATTSQPSELPTTTAQSTPPRDVAKILPTMDAVATHHPAKGFKCPAICRPGKDCICPSRCRNCYTPRRRPAKSPKITGPYSFGKEQKPCILTFYDEANQQVGPTATNYKKTVTKTTTVDCKGCAATTKLVVSSAPTPTTTVSKRRTTSTVTVCADNTKGLN
ncbi:hypothetical protein N7G274_010622 [Stereocaulon virgatum]|uniref:Uncharacterized protein n=1 Tax=Stereocaulon virgatum TaxID=373712 RepID=A0ABR3ZT95_9LECA